MLKLAGMIVSVVAGLAVTGFGVTEIADYVRVAGRNAGDAIRSVIPLDVEIDRMELLIEQLDRQVDSNKRAVARAQVALQDAEQQHLTARQRCERLLQEIAAIRNRGNDVAETPCRDASYQATSLTSNDADLRFKLNAYKQSEALCIAQQAAMEMHRKAFQQLRQQFDKWTTERQLLSQRLETLRVRQQTQELIADNSSTGIDNTDLSEAKALADRIERELRITEAQQTLGSTSAISSDTSGDQDNAALHSEIDALLNQQAS